MSMVMTSGFSDSASATASRPSLALPTTCSCSSALKIPSRTFRMNDESSTTSTRNFLLVVAIVRLRYRRYRPGRLRSNKLFNCCNQLIFLHRLGQERCGAFLHRAIAMFCARPRRNHHRGNPARRGTLAQLHHQLVARNAGYFEVGNDEMAAVLGYQVSGFEPIGGKFHAITVLFQHSADEFAHADGVVRHDDYALLRNAVDSLGRNAAARNRRRARSKDSCGAGAGLYLAMFAWFCRYHAVQIN